MNKYIYRKKNIFKLSKNFGFFGQKLRFGKLYFSHNIFWNISQSFNPYPILGYTFYVGVQGNEDLNLTSNRRDGAVSIKIF